jgi:hypothetical protein
MFPLIGERLIIGEGLAGQRNGPGDPGVVAKAGGDDVGFEACVEPGMADIAGEAGLRLAADRFHEAGGFHHPAPEDQAVGHVEQDEACRQMGDIAADQVDGGRITGQLVEALAPALFNGRARGQPFEAIAMERAVAGEGVGRMVVRAGDVAALEVRNAHQRTPVAHHAGADTRADGGIGQRAAVRSVLFAPGALHPFAKAGAVDIGIHDDGGAERGQHVVKARALPARFGGGGESAIGGRSRVDVDRAEAGDAKGAGLAVLLLGRAKEFGERGKTGLRGPGGDAGAGEHFALRGGQGRDELGATGLDGADQRRAG